LSKSRKELAKAKKFTLDLDLEEKEELIALTRLESLSYQAVRWG